MLWVVVSASEPVAHHSRSEFPVSDKISTLGRGIKLPGMGTANPRPLSEVLNGRGGGAGDVEYEVPFLHGNSCDCWELALLITHSPMQEDWEERQSRMEESRTSTPQEKLAKMLQASQVITAFLLVRYRGEVA